VVAWGILLVVSMYCLDNAVEWGRWGMVTVVSWPRLLGGVVGMVGVVSGLVWVVLREESTQRGVTSQ
jgi:hypothetical protein